MNQKVIKMLEDVLVWLAEYGVMLGFIMLISPLLYDILFMGTRGFYEYAIGMGGFVIQFFGAIITIVSWVLFKFYFRAE